MFKTMMNLLSVTEKITYDCLRGYCEWSKPLTKQSWDGYGNVVLDASPYFRTLLLEGDGSKENCVFIFPAHAGRHPNIVNPLAEMCRGEGYDVFLFELLPACPDNVNLSNLIEFGHMAFAVPDQPKITMGTCQGLWQAAITLCLPGNKSEAFFGFAGPIDFRAGDNYLTRLSCSISPEMVGFALDCVPQTIRTWSQWWNFTMINPYAVFLGDLFKLLDYVSLDDVAGIAKWHRNRSWYWSPQALPKDLLKDVIRYLFCGNLLVQKKLKIYGHTIDLSRIKCPVYLYTGEKDEFISPEQIFNAESYLGSSLIKKRLFKNCGHTKVFTGFEELSEVKKDLRGIEHIGVVIQ